MKIEITNMCMLYQNDDILILDREESLYRGYTFPGGHIEDNETLNEGLIREIKEETGLLINSFEFVDVFEWKSEDSRYLAFLYKSNDFTGELKNSNEGRVFFINKNKLKRELLSVDFEEILRRYKIYLG